MPRTENRRVTGGRLVAARGSGEKASRLQAASDAGAADDELAAARAEIARRATEREELLAELGQTRKILERRSRDEQRLRQRLREELRGREAVTSELDELRRSSLFRMLGSYRSLVERAMPRRSRRREVYGALVSRLLGSGRSAAQHASGTVDVPALPTSVTPEASIVIPVHGGWSLTRECLRSLAAYPPEIPFEVIVVDDASTDETPAALEHVSGIRVSHLGSNVGFTRAVNAGTRLARGRYIVLLNNDTVPLSGWLDALVRTAESYPDAGVVGAKLVYPDGTLQEAGSIIWSDGHGWNFGRGEAPDDPRFNFLREVDYCSGACVLVRRGVLTAVGGGLDQRFSPAYYEDTDLAFAARQLGHRVLYQPEAVVCHVEGASHGTDPSSGGKRFQEINRRAFVEKWAAELTRQPANAPEHVRGASWRTARGHVVVIDHWVPTPDRDSGSRRMFELLCLLSGLGFAVSFVPDDEKAPADYTRPLQQRGIEVLSTHDDLSRLLEEVGSAVRAVILARPAPASAHLPLVREKAPAAKIIYDTVDLHFVREGRRAQVECDSSVESIAAQWKAQELGLVASADASFVVSPDEREMLLAENPSAKIHVVPNIHSEASPGPAFIERQGLLFVGGFAHPPNRDAVHWLVEDVLPIVRDRLGHVHTYIVGSNPTEDISALASDDVAVLGWVPYLADVYDWVRVFVAPLRYGAGIKGKVGESLAHGLPVVTTRIGAEGMDLEHEHDVLIADDASGFAAEIVRAYQDPDLWDRLSRNGRRTISDRFSPAAVEGLLGRALDDLGLLDLPASGP